MYRNYLCVEVVILLLLSHVGWNGPSSPRVQPCSRSQSRVARQLVRRKFTGVLQRYRVPMSPDCPFHPSRDLYWWPQGPAAGSVGSASPGWKCPMCGRGFFCEDKLTSHWDQEHAPDLPKVDNGVCLADYCDILRCDVLGHKLAASEVAPPPRQQARTDPKCVGSAPTDDPRCSCDEKHMLALQQKCRIVVQQCVIGLLSILSVKDFQDIEEELNNGICSYLTCNKYWDDTLIEERQIPLLFSVIIGIILVGGFCLCYYIVWILFDNPPYDEVYCNSRMQFSSFGLAHGDSNQGTLQGGPQCHCHSHLAAMGQAAYHARKHCSGRR
ncbi:unnamed protein product [Ixodes persulcatus]